MENESSIHIWKDRWIHSPTNYSIQSPVRILPHDATVNSLIDVDTQWWNIPLITEIFIDDEVRTICHRSWSDQLVWTCTNNGQFTIRSASHTAKEKVQSVVKVLLWKVCNNILPTKENLFKKIIVSDPTYAICDLGTKTIGHILWSCPSARDAWIGCNKRIHKISTHDYFFKIYIYICVCVCVCVCVWRHAYVI